MASLVYLVGSGLYMHLPGGHGELTPGSASRPRS
jgi:hypothetical protein